MALLTLSLGRLIAIRAENFGAFLFVLLTTFLVAPASWKHWRQLGCIGIVLIWANCHGTFMMGFALILMKTAIEIARYFVLPRLEWKAMSTIKGDSDLGQLLGIFARGTESSTPADAHDQLETRWAFQKKEVVLWAVTCGLCIVVMAFANPFGIANLMMPFQQVGAEAWTSNVRFWRPLIQGIVPLKLYGGDNALPFLFSLALIACMLFSTAYSLWSRRSAEPQWSASIGSVRSDLLVEALICLAVIGLTFRFGRAALFASLAAIPVMALLFQFCGEAILSWTRRFRAGRFAIASR